MKKISIAFVALFIVLASSAQSDTTLKEYAGRYVFPDGNVVPDVTIAVEGNSLTISSSAGTSAMEKLGVDSFSIVEFQGHAVFKRNSSNKVSGIHIEAAGYVMDGTKEQNNGWAFIIRRRPEYVYAFRKNGH